MLNSHWKIYVLVLIVLLLTIVLIKTKPFARERALFENGGKATDTSSAQVKSQANDSIIVAGTEYGELVKNSLDKTPAKAFSGFAQIGITSHHLPTAADFISEFYQTLKSSKGPRQTFVVTSPDHFNQCANLTSVTDRPFRTPYGDLQPDQEIIDQLINQGVSLDNKCFEGEHGIGAQAMFIKALFPDAKIVPLIFSGGTQDEILSKISRVLSGHKDRVTLIASVDFSHYQNTQKANKLDSESGEMIKSLSGKSLDLEHMDSPPSIRLAMLLAQVTGAIKVDILGHANSYDFTRQSENTTGYFSILFEK